MLLFIRDYGENPNVLKIYNNTQLMNELTQYLSFDVPSIIIDGLNEDLEILHTAISRNKCRVRVTDAFSLFLYVHTHRKGLYPVKLRDFVFRFYDSLPSNKGVFRLFNQKKERWASNPVQYYQWYMGTFDTLYHAFLDGVDWDEISRLQVKD